MSDNVERRFETDIYKHIKIIDLIPAETLTALNGASISLRFYSFHYNLDNSEGVQGEEVTKCYEQTSYK